MSETTSTKLNTPSERAKALEAMLFVLGKPVAKKEITQELNISDEELVDAITAHSEHQGALTLVDDDTHLELRTEAAQAALVERVVQDDTQSDIGRAGFEVLACLLYKNALSRPEIDFIRGVNSSQTLRSLLMRGLIKKVSRDERTQRYEVTTDLLGALGITHISELPQYTGIRETLQKLEDNFSK